MASQNVVELIIRLKDELSSGVGRVQQAMEAFNREVKNGHHIFSEVSASLLKLGAAFLSLEAIKEVAKGFLDTAAAMERYETTLTTVLDSHARAKQTLVWIKEFAQTTPYEVPELVEATTRLEAYGLSAQEYLRGLGDTAAAMGKPIMAAVEMIADASQGEFERMKEFGLRASDVAREAGFKSVTEMTSTRDNLIKGTETLMAMLEKRYSGGMQALSKTWTGMVSNLKDAWTNFLLAVAESGAFDRLKAQLQGALDKVTAMARSGELEQWARQVGEFIAWLIERVAEMAKLLWEHRRTVAYFAAGLLAISPAIKTWQTLTDVVRGLTAALSVLTGTNVAGWAAKHLTPLAAKGGLMGGAAYLGWKAGEVIQDYLQAGPLYEAKQAEKELEEAKQRLAWTQERYNAALEERNKRAQEAEAAVARQTAEEERLREAQEQQVQTLEGELTKAVKTYTDAREKLNKTLEAALAKELALAEQVAKQTGDVGKGVDAKILQLKRAAAEQIAAGLDPELVVRAFGAELEKLKAEVQAKATEAWGKWETEGSNAAAATAQSAEAALARIGDLIDAVELDLKQETATVFGDVRQLVADATAEIEARLRQLDAQQANPVIGVVDQATAKINEIIAKLQSIPTSITTWIDVRASLPGEFTITVPGYASGGVLTEPTLLYQRGRLVGVAAEAGPEEIRPLRRGSSAPVNIYINEKLDRQTIRRVLIPEIERAWARA